MALFTIEFREADTVIATCRDAGCVPAEGDQVVLDSTSRAGRYRYRVVGKPRHEYRETGRYLESEYSEGVKVIEVMGDDP